MTRHGAVTEMSRSPLTSHDMDNIGSEARQDAEAEGPGAAGAGALQYEGNTADTDTDTALLVSGQEISWAE